MSITEYLEAEPLSEIVRYHKSGSPKDAVSFPGTLRKHPYDDDKCLLIGDPSGHEPAIFEFKTADIVSIEELPAPIDSAGKPRPLVRLWVRKGSFGIRYEPFEVDDPLRFPTESGHLRERFNASVRTGG